ncbi:MAG: hypothetical protein MI802_20960 [Desulfobacterales bacterium]|nr:hypothetical protein [Desulfobacterales bacterium]
MSTERPEMPQAALKYGAIVYWVTIVSCIICMVGPVIAVAFPTNNVLNPYMLFDAIFQGKDAATIWNEVGGGFPGGHFYLSHLNYGDGITMLGLALGCSVALWALLVSAVEYAKEKSYTYVIMSIWVCALVALSLLGLVSAH